MSQNQPISVEELQTETNKFLIWVEERKMDGFMGREIENFRGIVLNCLKSDTLFEIIEQVTHDIRRWINDWWSPHKIGKKYLKYKNHTTRAEVIIRFPKILNDYLELLSRIENFELDEAEQKIFKKIKIRLLDSTKQLDLDAVVELSDEEFEKTEEEKAKKKRKRMATKNRAKN